MKIGISGVAWHTFRHTVATMLATGEHQTRDSGLLASPRSQVGTAQVERFTTAATNEGLRPTRRITRLAQEKFVDAHQGRVVGQQIKSNSDQGTRFSTLLEWEERLVNRCGNAYWAQTNPNCTRGPL
jgi:hypothetical protein